MGLRQFFSKELRDASKTAKEFLSEKYPEFTVHHSALQADEATRYVFAVFYTTPDRQIKPTPYKLVAFCKATSLCQELMPPSDSDYRIKGRR